MFIRRGGMDSVPDAGPMGRANRRDSSRAINRAERSVHNGKGAVELWSGLQARVRILIHAKCA
jgi:hypothetical protein